MNVLAVARGETDHSDYAHLPSMLEDVLAHRRDRGRVHHRRRWSARRRYWAWRCPLTTALYAAHQGQRGVVAARPKPPGGGRRDERVRRRLRRGRKPVRRAPGQAEGWRCGPTTWPSLTSTRSTRNGLRLTGERRRARRTCSAAHRPARDPPLRVRDRRDQGDVHRDGDRRDRPRVRRWRGLQRPERRRQRGGDRRARRARDPRHDVPCGPRGRAGRRPDGHARRHVDRAIRAATGIDGGGQRLAEAITARRDADQGARRTPAARSGRS